MGAKHGNLSINSENIFPIIKKWMYSDHDIFVRELISNGCDAITKLKKLDMMGEYQLPDDYKASIKVVVNPEEKTLKFIDTGIGMTADEVEEYITQIAFSGATEFLEKYKDKTTEDDMIGHFGLGFYSAFMVADEVHIDTLSYKDGATPVRWVSNGGTEYEMTEGDKQTVGSEITLYLNDDCLEFANEYRVREVIQKYCSFMPVEIFLSKANAEPEYETIDEAELKEDDEVVEHIHEDAKTEEKENENGEKEMVEVSPAKDKVKIKKRPESLSDIHPLWTKHPNECSDEDYKEFYRKVFLDYKEPLFWIHLNMDYPFNLKGILYFPKINHEFAGQEGQIKLYNNQVFVADNVKEVIPEFLMLLKGVIDCPDLPLNVSRSFLQNDGYVKKISSHITKKVADKLTSIYNNERENYEKYWDYINIFIKYGCLRDEKFYEKVKDVIIYKDIDGKYLTLDEYLDGKEEKDVYYVSDPQTQSQYINMFKNQGLNAVVLPSMMDTHFISLVEIKQTGVKFKRIDSAINDISDNTEKDDSTKEQEEKLIEKFKNEIKDDTLKIEVQSLKDDSIPAVILLGEQSRRMQEMYKAYGQQMAGMADMFHDEFTLILNSNNSLIKKIDTLNDEDANLVIDHVYDLAKISHSPLPAEQMTKFIERSNKLLEKLF